MVFDTSTYIHNTDLSFNSVAKEEDYSLYHIITTKVYLPVHCWFIHNTSKTGYSRAIIQAEDWDVCYCNNEALSCKTLGALASYPA